MNTQSVVASRKAPQHLPLPPKSLITLTVNGTPTQMEVAPWTTLLDALREYLGLTGTKKGCDHGQCGACTVLVEGRRIYSCLTLAVMHAGAKLTSTLKTGHHGTPNSTVIGKINANRPPIGHLVY